MHHPAQRHEFLLDDDGADIAAVEHHELDDIVEESERGCAHAELELEADHVARRAGKLAEVMLAAGQSDRPRHELLAAGLHDKRGICHGSPRSR